MAQNKASRRRVLRSSLKHKGAADRLLDAIETMTENIAAARVKVAADTDTSWDTDYVSTLGVTELDLDSPQLGGPHRASLRKMLIDKLAHKALGNDLTDVVEESQVTLNLVLAQMDTDAGTLSDDTTYEAYRVIDPIDVDAPTYGQHKASFRRTFISAISHKKYGNELSDEIEALESELNALITDIQAKNA